MFHLESSYPLSSIFLSAKQSRARHGFKQQRVVNLIRPSLLIISSDDDICSSDNVKDKPSIRPPVCISTALKRAPDLRKIDRLVAEMRDAFGTIPCFLPSKILHAISQSARSSCLTKRCSGDAWASVFSQVFQIQEKYFHLHHHISSSVGALLCSIERIDSIFCCRDAHGTATRYSRIFRVFVRMESRDSHVQRGGLIWSASHSTN